MGKKVSAGAAGTTNSALPVRLVLSINSMLHTRQLLRMSYRQSPSICTAPQERGAGRQVSVSHKAQMHASFTTKVGRQPNGGDSHPNASDRHTQTPEQMHTTAHSPAYLVDLRRLRLRGQRDHDVHILQVKAGG